MFSGIVAATGRIQNVSPLEDGVRLTVDVGSLDLSDVQLGDSIANNGVCLTVIAQDATGNPSAPVSAIARITTLPVMLPVNTRSSPR